MKGRESLKALLDGHTLMSERGLLYKLDGDEIVVASKYDKKFRTSLCSNGILRLEFEVIE